MKKYVSVSLFVFWAIVVSIMTAGLVLHDQNQGSVSTVASSTSRVPTYSNNKMNSISSTEVAKHNTASDCWQIVNGNVYNLTSFVNNHSGGSTAITQTCGQDGSVSFNTKDGRGFHARRDQAILNQYLVGPLK